MQVWVGYRSTKISFASSGRVSFLLYIRKSGFYSERFLVLSISAISSEHIKYKNKKKKEKRNALFLPLISRNQKSPKGNIVTASA